MKKKNIKYKHVFAEGDTLNTVVTGNKSTQANTNWGAAASGAASLIGQGINNLQTPKYTANQYQFTDTNSILASNPGTIKAQTTNTLGATASGAASGAAIGSIVPGIGTAIGGVIGGATGLLTSIFGNNKKKKAAEEANRVNTENFQTAATSSQQNNLMQSLNNNTNAFGGDIFSQGGR